MLGRYGTVALCVLALAATATAGTLQGRIVDKDSGEELIAADVLLIGTGLATQTDLEGYYSFADLAAGQYNVRVSYLGYNTRVVPEVEVPASGTRTLDIQLESFRADEIDDVMITATRVLSTESAVLADRKNAAVVGDAISAAQISRSPDGQAGDAMKRVTGVTVRGGQYINVRGMPDRYNVTIVDGTVVTSVDPDLDRKSFNFEMIPAGLLASLKVVKTPTPDMPGDLTGGLVEINTKEFPDRATTSVSVGAGWDQDVTGELFLSDAYSGDRDFWGFDDGGRDLPGIVLDAGRQPFDGEAYAYADEVARALPNRYATETSTAPLGSSFSVSHGNKFGLAGREIGLIGAVTFGNGRDIHDESKSYLEEIGGQYTSSDWLDYRNYETSSRMGALLNLNLKLAERQTFSFKNLFGHTAEENFLVGYKFKNQLIYRRVLEWEEKSQLTSSFGGSHALPLGDVTLDWQMFYNENTAKEPDLRWLDYNAEQDEPRMLTNRRHWLYIDEFRRGVDTDLTWRVGDVDRPTTLKAGLALSHRERLVDHRPYKYDWPEADNSAGGTVLLPPEQIFAPENLKEGLLTLRYQDQFESTYIGSHVSNAYYVMVDTPFDVALEEFRLSGGVRIENTQYAVDAFDKVTNTIIPSRSSTTDVIPSVNLIYFYDEDTNVRLAYFGSVNYPDLRELADVSSIDLMNDYTVRGNPDLRRARISNYDLRVEHFPEYGEVLALSFFYKDMRDAIESRLTESSAYVDELSFFNSDGENYGFELELRKKLDFLGEEFSDITVQANYTRIWSTVDFPVAVNPEDEGQSADTILGSRQVQGQSPYVINLSLQWEDVNLGTSVNLLFNKLGRRLDRLKAVPQFNVYEEPRNLLDAAITQKVPGGGKLKFTAKNILAADTRWRWDIDQSQGVRDPRSREYGRRTDGTSYKLSLSWKF
ncbi:TonB-dependent receptor plug domain-containing protein [bacterium]|nr:TonB-dependent receptor plug domain-containing protein [bacterium]